MRVNGKNVLKTGKENKLYNITAYTAITEQERTDLFHKRLGHASLKRMNKWASTVKGVRKFKDPGSFCTTCALSKMARKRFGKSKQETQQSGDLVVGDLEGPFPTLGPKREKFAFHIYDVHDGYLDSFAMKNKSDSEKVFNDYEARFRNRTGRSIKTFRTDGGTEFINWNIYKTQGIEHQITNRYTPQQNGISERQNRTVMDTVRCLLKESGLPDWMWTYAMDHTTDIINMIPI
jgi:transposase InsO family protein